MDDCKQFCSGFQCDDSFSPEGYFSYNWDLPAYHFHTRVQGCFYETLELGDIFCFLKSDALEPLLALAHYLYGRECVSAVYSYVGVNCARIPPDGFSYKERIILSHLSLNYISTRFSVRQVREAQDFLQKKYAPPGDPYYVAGTADIMIQWKEKNEYALLCWLRDFLAHLRERPDHFYKSFYDVITRIGIVYEHQEDCRETDLPASRLAAFDRVVDYVWLYDEAVELPSEWGPTLMRLLAMLRTMSANSAMDDLAAMLIPSVRAFLSRLKRLSNAELRAERWNGTITYFLERWIRLTDDMLHLESQLTQHPELNPSPHAVPAMLLQLEQRFVRQAADLLEDRENKIEGGFIPVIFPCLTDHIRTRSILNPHDETGKGGSCPLCIEAPVEQLFSPFVIEHILIHEVAHYCGAALRLRNPRLDCLCHCYAYAIVHYWHARITENCFISKLSHPSALGEGYYDRLAKRVEDAYRKMVKTGEAESLNEIKQYLPQAAIKVLSEHEEYEDFLRRLIADQPLDYQMEYAQMDYWRQDYVYYSRFSIDLSKHGDLLYHLCKECYADVAMICLLNCKPLDYYNAVFGLEMTRLEERRQLPLPYRIMRRHWVRLRLVCNAIGTWRWLDMEKEKEAELKKHPFSGPFTESTLDYAISENEHIRLLAYLKECKLDIKSHLFSKPDQVAELRKIYRATRTESFDWDALRRYAENAAREWHADDLSR